MITPPKEEARPVEVTQADRDAAAFVVRSLGLSRVTGHQQHFAAMVKDGYEDDAPIVQAFARHRLATLPPQHSSGDAREALRWFVTNGEGLKSDVRSGHSARGNGASEWMREDDSDFRVALSEALKRAEAALSRQVRPEGVGAELYDAIRGEAPNGELVGVHLWPDGAWDVFKPGRVAFVGDAAAVLSALEPFAKAESVIGDAPDAWNMAYACQRTTAGLHIDIRDLRRAAKLYHTLAALGSQDRRELEAKPTLEQLAGWLEYRACDDGATPQFCEMAARAIREALRAGGLKEAADLIRTACDSSAESAFWKANTFESIAQKVAALASRSAPDGWVLVDELRRAFKTILEWHDSDSAYAKGGRPVRMDNALRALRQALAASPFALDGEGVE